MRSYLAYRYASSNYLSDVFLAALDRDADTHTVSMFGYFNIPNTEITMQAGYFHIENDTDGANYESDADSFRIGLQSPLIWKIKGYARYTKIYNDYDNPDLFSATGAVRDDDIDTVTLHLTRPLTKWLSFYARFDHTNNDSNIAVFNYDQNMWSAGLAVDY